MTLTSIDLDHDGDPITSTVFTCTGLTRSNGENGKHNISEYGMFMINFGTVQKY